MVRPIVPNDFFSEVFHGVHTLPLKGFALAAGVGAMNVAVDLSSRRFGFHASVPEYFAVGVLTFVALGAVYLIAMMIAETSSSWSGGLRFVGTTILIIGAPVGILFGSLWLMRILAGAAVVILGLMLLALLFALPLLSAWPIAQALSTHFVSPLRIVRATKGYRWGLFTASYASTAINKLLPATDTAKSSSQAIALAIGNGAITCLSLVLLASIAATGWKFAIRRDPTLVEGADVEKPVQS